MLAKDPGQRPGDASAVLLQLDAVGPLIDVAAPHGGATVARPSRLEQELVSVILAAPSAEQPSTSPPRSDSGVLPGSVSPGSVSPGSVSPGTVSPGTVSPGTVLPATLLPATLMQKTVSRETAAPDSALPETLLPEASAEPALPDVSPYGGELKRLADGTLVVVLAQRGSAATDLVARAARCALRLRVSCPGWHFVVATGRGIREQQFCLGEAIDRAGTMLRAQAERGPAAIWLDEVSAGLLGARFEVQPHAAGLTVLVLSGEDPSADAARPLLGRPTACVGRDRELGMLQLSLDACLEERDPRALLVFGPPGIGKSRLRHEFLRHCARREQPLTVLLGLGDPLRTSGQRSLLGGAIARWLGLSADASDAQNWIKLSARVADYGSREPQLLITFLGELCGLAAPLPLSTELRAARQNPNIMADRIAGACLELLRAEARARPLLLVLDDLQWSDARTVELVGMALRELHGLPFLVLALGRPEAQELFPDLWAPRLTRMPLQPLPASATRRLIQQVLGDRVSDDTVQRIVSQAGGNALFLEELIRATSARRERVPETVLAMLQARIGLLPAAERRVLRSASVLGEVFPLAGVQALLHAGEESTELEAALASLCEHEILERQADDRSAGRMRFRHALMRDAAYALLTPEDLVSLHGLAARHLESSGEDPVVVALHAERGADRERAVRQYALGAERAYLRNNLAAVVALVARGVACGATGEELGVLRSIEAPALSYQHDFAAGWAASEQAVALLPPGHPKRLKSLAANTFAGLQLGKVIDAQVEELLDTDPDSGALPDYVSALGYAGIAHLALAQRGYALRVIERLHGLDAALGEEDAFARGHSYYWQLRFQEMLGEDSYAAWQLAERAVTFNERAGNRRMVACSLASLGECQRRMCSPERAEPAFRRAAQLARELAEPISWSFVQQYLATFLAERAAEPALSEADALAREAIELAGDGAAYRALALISRALVSLGRGELAQAEARVRESRALLRSIQLRAYYPHVELVFLRVLLAQGQQQAAGTAADEALDLLQQYGPFGVTELPLRLWIARALLAAGRTQDAARSVAQALELLERRALRVPDAALREAFREQVPEHVALRELARELARAAPPSLDEAGQRQAGDTPGR